MKTDFHGASWSLIHIFCVDIIAAVYDYMIVLLIIFKNYTSYGEIHFFLLILGLFSAVSSIFWRAIESLIYGLIKTSV